MRSHALRLPSALALTCLVFTFAGSSAFAADSGRRLALPAIQVSPALQAREAALSLTPAARLQEFTRLMQENNVAQQDRPQFSAQFQQLPDDLQMSILERTSPRVNSPVVSKLNTKYLGSAMASGAILAMLTPSGKAVVPDKGETGAWSYATGTGLNTNCKATLDGGQMESVYLNIPPFLPNSLFFRVPAGASRGVNHSLAVVNTSSSRTSAAIPYAVVAMRGYRGLYGWQFSNFGDPTVPWEMYRDYFGASAVQYSDGTHRPAAQTWYDHNYKGVGGGGNCFGMGLSSLRFRNHALISYWHTWFSTPPNAFPFVWNYPTPYSHPDQADGPGVPGLLAQPGIPQHPRHHQHPDSSRLLQPGRLPRSRPGEQAHPRHLGHRLGPCHRPLQDRRRRRRLGGQHLLLRGPAGS